MSLLEVNHLCTSFFTTSGEVKAVNDLSFSLEKGKVLVEPVGGCIDLLDFGRINAGIIQ